MNKKWYRPIILLIILAVLFFQYRKQRSLSISNYITTSATNQSVNDVIKADGQITSHTIVTLNFLTSAKLTYLGVKKGDSVKKYQALARIDAKELENAVTTAHYQYILLDAKAKEVEDELKGHDTDETFAQGYERKAAQIPRDEAYDSWLLAKRELADASLYSPINGIVSEVTPAVVGDIVSPADYITVIDPNNLYFEAQIDETDFSKVNLNQSVDLILDAYPDTTFKGQIVKIAKVGTQTQTGGIKILAEIDFDSQNKNLVTELNGTAQIILDTKKALVIPNDYVVVKNGNTYVYIVDGKYAKLIPVEIGQKYGNLTEITSGLSEGQLIAKKK
jgi:RND family efflux transporter MFP subunit